MAQHSLTRSLAVAMKGSTSSFFRMSVIPSISVRVVLGPPVDITSSFSSSSEWQRLLPHLRCHRPPLRRHPPTPPPPDPTASEDLPPPREFRRSLPPPAQSGGRTSR